MTGLAFYALWLGPWLCAAAVAVGAGLWFAQRRRERLRAEHCGPRTARVSDADRGGERQRAVLLWGGWLAVSTALLRPAWGESLQPLRQQGVDMVVCLDVSRSMLAQDVLPNRLERARSAVAALSERAVGDRLGLVCFAGEARLAMPLTRSAGTYRELLKLATPRSIRRGGTDLAAALDTAADALDGGVGGGGGQAAQGTAHRCIVLITDGEDHGAAGQQAARRCAERGIQVHCLGYGSRGGSKVVLGAAGDGGASFLTDSNGDQVVTALDESALRAIAEAGLGGAFVDGSRVPEPLVSLYAARIAPAGQELVAAVSEARQQERFQWPLIVGCLAWLLAMLSPRRRVA